MRRGAKIVGAALGVLVALLILNTIAVGNQTKAASPSVAGAQILEAFGGDVQVLEEGIADGPPVVLIHGYASSLRWWDRMVPHLTDRHRVIRLDLLGHGGSEKPATGYSPTDQAAAVASVLSQLRVAEATIVGHSMGATVATALTETSPALVGRMAIIGRGPSDEYGSPGFTQRIARAPVIGEALWRATPDFAIRSGYRDAFAPGFSFARGFEDPDQPVADRDAMTFTAFDESPGRTSDYTEESSLDERLAALEVPLLVIFGSEDRLYEAEGSAEAYRGVPGARVTVLEGIGHSPNVEVPEETARLILAFMAETGGAPEAARGRRGDGRARGQGGAQGQAGRR